MRLLLDTHVWLWRLLEPKRVSTRAEEAIADSQSELLLSPISTWETLVLARKGRIDLRPSPSEWVLDALRRSAPTAAPLTHGIALRSEALAGFASEDPADRFLVATALELDLVLVTADGAMHEFPPLDTLW
ncbi:MAG TPA: type II toxin-antitoxin system VapC family toxin [Solirubrobacterales bacterium]|nr:type II toxin-antitoxin system VapC family toxin [Solirubrobacterales bacterium]